MGGRYFVKAMIHDLVDLEPLLRQYHPEKVLVGPLLNLWTNSDKFDTSIVPEKTIEQKKDSQTYGFRPLTDDEKKEFENALNDDGKKILQELSEKPDTKVTQGVSKRKTKTHSIWSAAVIPTIIDP
jgi:hypothetical protein